MRLLAVPFVTVALLLPGETSRAARPLATEDAPTVAPDEIELESGMDFVRVRPDEWQSSAGVTLKAGLGSRMDAGLTLPYAFQPVPGWEPVEMGFKFALLGPAGVKTPPLSITFCHCPTATDYSLTFTSGHEMRGAAVHVNAGYHACCESGGSAFCWGCAVELGLFRSLDAVGEFSGAGDERSGLAGWRFSAAECCVLDAGIGVTFEGSDSIAYATAGLTLSL